MKKYHFTVSRGPKLFEGVYKGLLYMTEELEMHNSLNDTEFNKSNDTLLMADILIEQYNEIYNL